MKQKRIQIAILSIVLLIMATGGKAQVNITGPACVITGAEYQYNISSNWDSANIQICLTGGVLEGMDTACYSGAPVSDIRVIWTDSISGAITVTSNQLNTSFDVVMTTELQGGSIDSASAIQNMLADSIPSPIYCSEASGGNCAPEYKYQWQQSIDGTRWTDITGAWMKDLQFSSGLQHYVFYRRKVSNAGSESFSDIAMVLIVSEIVLQP